MLLPISRFSVTVLGLAEPLGVVAATACPSTPSRRRTVAVMTCLCDVYTPTPRRCGDTTAKRSARRGHLVYTATSFGLCQNQVEGLVHAQHTAHAAHAVLSTVLSRCASLEATQRAPAAPRDHARDAVQRQQHGRPRLRGRRGHARSSQGRTKNNCPRRARFSGKARLARYLRAERRGQDDSISSASERTALR